MRRFTNHLGTVLLVCAGFLCASAVVSCSTADSATKQAAYEEAVALVNASAAEVERLKQKPNKSPAESASLAKAEATIEMLQAKLAEAVDSTGQFDEVRGLQMITDFTRFQQHIYGNDNSAGFQYPVIDNGEIRYIWAA